jgi:hypothetical protein
MSFKIDGLDIPTSDRGSTGLYNVSYTPAFTGTNRPPFVAFVNRNSIERLEPRLTQDAYPYGGDVFNIGAFETAAQAAYARAFWLANIENMYKWWVRNGGPSRQLRTFSSFPWQFPDLSSIETPEIKRGIEAAYNVYKNGGSQADIEAAAERERQRNIKHIERAKVANNAEDQFVAFLSKPEFKSAWQSTGTEKADARDYAIDMIKDGSSYEEVLKSLKGYLNESRKRRENNEFLREFNELKNRIKRIL